MAKKTLKNTSASSFLKGAAGHHHALQLVYPHVGSTQVPEHAVFFAFYNMFGFALELYFKAFLSGKGLAVKALSEKPYSHNLVNLFDEAVSRGLFDLVTNVDNSALEKVVSVIGPRFSDFTYRYIDDDNNEYQYISTMEYVWPVLNDLRFRIEASGVSV